MLAYFLSIISGKSFRGGVLQSSPPFGKPLVWCFQYISCKPEVDDLKLRKLLVLFQEDVLRLKGKKENPMKS
jgi:hypothetical protein